MTKSLETLFFNYCEAVSKAGLGTVSSLKINQDNFLNLKENIKNNLLPLFEEVVVNVLGIKGLPPYNLTNVVQGILYGQNDYIQKLEDLNYYKQNALAFIKTVESILITTDRNTELEKALKIKRRKNYLSSACMIDHIDLLKDLFFNSFVLINKMFDWKNIDTALRCDTSSFNPLHMMNGELHSVLYGHHTPLSTLKFRVFPAIPTLRIMIEVKIRNAFGIIALKNKQSGTLDPINLSKIFEAVKKYVKSKDVQFNVDFQNLIKIYKWSNLYVHSGFKGFLWYPFIFEMYLKPFFNGDNVKLPNNRWNKKAGILIKKDALPKIQKDIESNYQLICFDREAQLEAILI